MASPISGVVGHDAFLDEADDLCREDVRHPAAFLPEDVSDRGASGLASVGAHVEPEMLVHVGREEAVLWSCESREAPRSMLQRDIGQKRLNFLSELEIVLGELQHVLGEVLELDQVLILLEIFGGAESIRQSLVPLELPAFCVAVQRLSVLDRLADGEHEAVPTLAVVSHLGLTWRIRTRLAWMAVSLASVLAACSRLHASLAAALFHELLDRREALALRMADFLADVAAFQREAAWLSAARRILRAVNSFSRLLAAPAGLGHRLQTWRAVAEMAGERTLVAAGMDLLARPRASWRELSALHGWISLGNTARAVERLTRVDFARLAGAKMAKVVADVLSA